jgi:hypothetical protein
MEAADDDDYPLLPLTRVPSLSSDAISRYIEDTTALIAAVGSAGALPAVLQRQVACLLAEQVKRTASALPAVVPPVIARSQYLSYNPAPPRDVGSAGRATPPNDVRPDSSVSTGGLYLEDSYTGAYGEGQDEALEAVLGPDSVAPAINAPGGGTQGGGAAGGRPAASEFVVVPEGPRRRKKRMWEKDKKAVGEAAEEAAAAVARKELEKEERRARLSSQLERQAAQAEVLSKREAKRKAAELRDAEATAAARDEELAARVVDREARKAERAAQAVLQQLQAEAAARADPAAKLPVLPSPPATAVVSPLREAPPIVAASSAAEAASASAEGEVAAVVAVEPPAPAIVEDGGVIVVEMEAGPAAEPAAAPVPASPPANATEFLTTDVAAGSERWDDKYSSEEAEEDSEEEEEESEEEEREESPPVTIPVPSPQAAEEEAEKVLAVPHPPPSYADVFPDFASIFSGCPRAALGIGRANAKGVLPTVTAEAAASHQLKLLRSLRAVLTTSPEAVEGSASALSGYGPEPMDVALDGDDDGQDALPSGTGARAARPGTGSTVSSVGARSVYEVGTDSDDAAPASATPPARASWYRAVDGREEVYSIFQKGLAKGGCGAWWELPAGWGTAPVWSLLWSWSKPPVHRALLLAWQRVNHFRGNNELCRKDLLKKNLARYAVLGPKMAAAWSLQPPTFVLPKEYLPFCEAFGKASGAAGPELSALGRASPTPAAPNVWIMKPVGLSRGRGIRLVSDIGAVRWTEPMVIQKYVANPLTLDGYKFDLRIYVLVTSFAPLEAFIYRRGFARLTTERYSLDPESLANRFVHLTNAAVQKVRTGEAGGDVSHRVEGADETSAGGSKVSLELLWKRLRAAGVDTAALWENICDLVVKSLLCVDDAIPAQPNSFEVFGYDVLIDEGLRPWLIEVNSSPSMATDSPMDEAVKSALVRDTLAVLDPLPYDHAALELAVETRLRNAGAAAKGGPTAPSAASGLSRIGPGAMAPVDRAALDADIAAILYGRRPRGLGELPAVLGEYTRLAPGTAVFARALKLKLAHIRAKGEASAGPR